MEDKESLLRQIKPCDMDRPYAFVSYSSKDYEIVWSDVLELQKRGYNIWLDEKNLHKTMDSWRDDALRAINDIDCQLLIFYASRNSLRSMNCMKELQECDSQATKDLRRQRSLHYIVIDAEPIGNINDFIDEVEIEVKALDSKKEKEEGMKALSWFETNVFHSNNERIRQACRTITDHKVDYYEDIIQYLKYDKGHEQNAPKAAAVNPRTSEKKETASASPNSRTPKEPAVKKRGVGISATGNITYTIYGKEHTDNQSDMMLSVFAHVLQQHQDKIADLPEQRYMNCVSLTDYSNPANRSQMPSYFRVCHYFTFDNAPGICVGTAYSIGDKMKKIAALLDICGEDYSVFSSDQVQLPVKKAHASAGSAKRKSTKTKDYFD